MATIANISVLGVTQKWGDLFGVGATVWAAIMLDVATVVGLIIAVTRGDIGFVMVFVWAFAAIINKQSATPVIPAIALITIIVLLVVLMGSIWSKNSGSRS